MFRKRHAVLSLGLVLLIIISLICFPVKALTVLNGDQLIYSFYLKDYSFSIQWKHSVEKEAWVEQFKVHNNGLSLEATKFKTFGAGVPSKSEHPAVLKDGWVHMDIERHIGDELVVRSNQMNDYQLQFGHNAYDLKPSDEAYVITVNEKPLYDIIYTHLKRIVR